MQPRKGHLILNSKSVTDSTQQILEILKTPSEFDSLEVAIPNNIVNDIPICPFHINYSDYLPGHPNFKVKQLPIGDFEPTIAGRRSTYHVYDSLVTRLFPVTEPGFIYRYSDSLWMKAGQTYTLYPNARVAGDTHIAELFLSQNPPMSYMENFILVPVAGAGYGVFLSPDADPIPKDTPLMLYSGEVISQASVQANELLGRDHYVVGQKSPGYSFSDPVDAYRVGNLASYINYAPTKSRTNYSGVPTQEYNDNVAKANVQYAAAVDKYSRQVFFIKTRKTLKPGKQVLADYGYQPDNYRFFTKDNSAVINPYNNTVETFANGPLPKK